ncbi:hypothetical protein QE428_001562 [Microbacterium sp. SORGH_AS 505]|uniref:hypothetical protein n=1 Tax=Microbacterium sp. SORGH_AS_0505 TaxID=3041770 RepID=UPI0027805556|nr:hypothetical protein [Microbacterium sp. SORGH_AS_0505]MDQ1126529.1 hypothetical protein [Microbacterium sp. SORGH_AS_0505]
MIRAFLPRTATAVAVAAALVLSTSVSAAGSTTSPDDEHELREVLDAALFEAEQQPITADIAESTGGGGVVFGDDSAKVIVLGQVLGVDDGALEGLQLPVSADGGVVLDDGTYVRTGDEVDLALQVNADDSSVPALTVIKGPDAPEEFVYELDLVDGAEAILNADGSVDITQAIEGGSEPFVVGGFEAPWAVDATGTEVATRYELRGSALVQIVDHRSADVAYPVVADPFWIPIIIVALKAAAHVTVKVGSRTVRYVPAAASTVTNALKNFTTLQLRAGAHTFKLDKAGIRHILTRHHPKYWDGSTKATQTFFNPNMSVADVKALVHVAMKQWPNTRKSKGTGSTFTLSGSAEGVKYTMTIQNGRVVQFYPC